MAARWHAVLGSAGLLAATLAAAAAAAAAPGAAAAVQATRPGAAGPAMLTRVAGTVRLSRPGPRLWRPGLRSLRPGRQTGWRARLREGRQAQVGTSANWSGYAVSGGPFRTVTASWVQPAVTCPGGSQYASFWVGLDGFGASSSVEQTGSEADCSHGSPRYYGWYELYPAYPVNFPGAVQPGDHLTGSVTSSGGSYTLVLTDSTSGWTRTVTGQARGATDASAEAITEAPSGSTGVLPLADFGTMSFTGITVNGSPIGTFSPTEIIMVNRAGRLKDLVSPLSAGEDFSVAWQRST